MNPKFEDSLEDAHILLQYVCSSGKKADAADIKSILDAQEAVDSKTLTTDKEANFWIAFQKLSLAAQPATATTIEFGTPSKLRFRHRSFLGILFTITKAFWGRNGILLRYRLITGLFVLLAIFLNGHWLLTNRTLTSIDQIQTEQESNANRLQDIDATLRLFENGDPKAAPLKLERSKIATRNDLLTNMQLANTNFLEFLTFGQLPTTKPGDPGSFQILRRYIENFSLVLYSFMLPLIFAGLGACVFVVRSLTTLLAQNAFDPNSSVGLRLRIFVGAIAGLIATQLFSAADLLSISSSISPLAIAFIVGYSVEVFFSALDKLVATFTDQTHQNLLTKSGK